MFGCFRQSDLQAVKLLSLKQLNKPNGRHFNNNLWEQGLASGGKEQGVAASGFPLGNCFIHCLAQSSHSETVPEYLLFVMVRGVGYPT